MLNLALEDLRRLSLDKCNLKLIIITAILKLKEAIRQEQLLVA